MANIVLRSFARAFLLGVCIAFGYILHQFISTINVSVDNCANRRILQEKNQIGATEAPSSGIISSTHPHESKIQKMPNRLYPNPNETGLVAPSGGITSLLKRSKKMVVPNVVHFVYFEAGEPFVFHQMVSVLSADRIIKPDVIKFHCDREPTGKYWEFIKKNVSKLEIKKISSTVKAGTKTPISPVNKSSVKRFQILQKEGGIYLDFDAIALKSFEPLRYYTMTMGIEYHGDPGRLNNGIMLAAPGAKFLQKILDQYAKNYRSDEGDRHCCQIPYYLQFQYPHDIHVEGKTLDYPSGHEMGLIYDKVYDWSNNYAIHLWMRNKKVHTKNFRYDENTIKTDKSTFGQVLRYVYYGSSDVVTN